MSKCSVEDCKKQARKTGLCGMHYERKRVHGDVNAHFPNKKSGKPCTVEGCGNLILSSDLCAMHYARKWRHGDTDSLLPNYGTHRVIHPQGYIRIWVNEESKYKMQHIMLAELALGKKLPDKVVVHHMNEDPADNLTPFNLIVCPDQAYHLLIHKRMKEYERFGKCFSI